ALRGAALSAGSDAAPAGSGRLLVLDQLARGRLVGRRAELEALRGLWQRSRQGHGHLALVSGEPGVGKTRLANETIVYAQLNGATVMHGSSYEYEATTPYLPFLEAVRGWVRAQNVETLRSVLGDSADELARFAPEIESKLGPFPPALSLPPQEERLRLFDHVARFIRRLALGGGLLLFFDDLHWADHGSLALMHYLLRNLKDVPWLALATYREVELGRDHPLANALVEWNRERLATRVTLGRFGPTETSALLATMFGQATVSEDFAVAIHRETEGNPFFIEEVVKSLIEQGQIYRDGDEWQRHAVSDLAIPQSIKSAVGRRLERLTPECAEVLHVAAALGKTFAFAELSGAMERDENKTLDALDEACATQLLRAEPLERFAFTHDKIREVLYEEQNPIRRRRLHARIGNALEKLYAADLDGHASDLAHHFSEGGELEKGLDYSLRAAQRATRVFATEEAIVHLSRARECAEALARTGTLCEIDERLGDLLRLRGEFAEALKAYERALQSNSEHAVRARLRLRLGETYISISDDRAMGHLNAALEELDAATQGHLRGQAWAMIGRDHHYKAEHGRAVEFLERAVTDAEPSAEPDDLAFIYGYMAGAYQHLAQFSQSMEWAKRSIEMGERRGNLTGIALGNEFMAEDLCLTGGFSEAFEYATRNLEIARRIGSLDRESWVYQPLATCWHAFGDLQRALEAGDEGLAVFARTGDRRGTVFLNRIRGLVLADLGRDGDAMAAAEDAKQVAGGIRQVAIQCQYRHALGYLHLQRHEWRQAIEFGREIEELCRGTDHRINLMLLARWYAPALLEAGEPAEAARVVETELELARLGPSEYDRAMGSATKGMIAARNGANSDALQLLDQGIAGLESLRERIESARLRVFRATLRRKMGDASGAEADERSARATFEASGATRDLERLG
ncbi:MAG: ATP-binding protein, partial [Candidatus Eiseniibacteriota bacterium]